MINNFSTFLIPLLILVVFLYFKHITKVPKINCMSLITGGVKSGKSTFGVYLAYKRYNKSVFVVKFKNFFRRLFKKELYEMPLLYSNIPLDIPYVPLTDELIFREKRFRYRSVVYVNEVSLMADSQLWRNTDINYHLLEFNKLIGHELKGGYIVYDTQTIADTHMSIKRCLSEYFYIHHTIKWIPFFIVLYIRECRYSEDNSSINVDVRDVESELKRLVIPKHVWKKFDAYCYSILTDDLEVADNVITKPKTLKATDIISFNTYFKNLFKFTRERRENAKKKH